MLRRVEVDENGSEPERRDVGAPDEVVAAAGVLDALPVPPGELDALLTPRPVFATRRKGYDPRQVDDYVRWAEDELATAWRREDHLRTRFAVCAAELAALRRRAAPAPVPSELAAVSERVREILRLASDEASEIVAAAAAEGDRIVADAQLEAEARLEKTAVLREAALARVEQQRERVVRERAEAAELLRRARREVDDLLCAAAEERERLATEATARLAREAEQARQDRDSAAAVAAGRLLAVQDEVEDLRRQRDEARESLRRLTEQIGQALHAVGVEAPEPNVVRSLPQPVAS